MEIDPVTLSRSQAYQLMISMLVPRPIAFVTTVSPSGVVNLAPFSFFNGISSQPPVVMIAVGRRRGERKDTARNALETGELCVNASTVALAEAINQSSADYPPDVSEVEATGLTTVPCTVIRPPRIALSPWSMECTLLHAWEPDELGTTVLFGRVLRYHVRDDLLCADGTIDPVKLDPLCRLGGASYAKLGAVFDLARPALPAPPERGAP